LQSAALARPPASSVRRRRGLLLIVVYKLAKGVLWLVFAVVILVLMRFGLAGSLLGFAAHLRQHAGAWSVELGKLVVSAASRRGLHVICVALVADGLGSLVEVWALVYGRWWGPWLVVVTTAALLPFEVVAFLRHRHAVRAAVFFANAAIAWYLARTAIRERREALEAR
jgi:uncharacterized membrane protein (DUF2068 family)